MHCRFLAHTFTFIAFTTLACGQAASDTAPAATPTAPAAPPTSQPAANGNAPAAPQDGTRPPGAFGPGGGGFPGGGFPGGGRGGFGTRRGGFGGGEGGAPGATPGEGETFTITGDQVMMQFATNPVADILAIYEKLTGLTLIKDTSIFEGAQISLVTPKPVAKEEAIKLIEASLLTNGYAIVTEPGGSSAKILPARSQSANAVQFSHGVKFYTSPKDIPDNESIVSYFMKLDNLSPEDAAQMLSGHVGLGAYGRITAVTTPPGLLITESATVVKQLINIRDAVDVGDTGSSLVTKFIPIQFGDSATIAQIIQATLTAQAQEKEKKGINTIRGSASDGRGDNNNNNNQQQRPQIVYSGSQQQQQNNQMAQPSAQVVADTRLNQILVVSSPADYAYIASLIAEFDKPLEVAEPFERKLMYAAALDVLSAVVDLLQEVNSGTTQLPGGGTIQQQRQQALATNSSQLLGGRTTTGTRGGTVGSTAAVGASDDATGTTSGIGSRADVISGPTENNAPVSVLVGKTRVVADPMSNSILVMGRKEDIDKTNSLLDKLDRKPAQVYLATVIGEITLTDGMTSGIDYVSALSRAGDGTNFSASGFTNRTDTLALGASGAPPGAGRAIGDLRNNLITTPFGPTSGLNLYGAIGDSLEVFVSALETNNNFKVLSRPSIFALNNKKAVITSGRQIPVPSQQTTFANNNAAQGNTTTTIEYRDVVLKLEIVPLINADGEVTLTVSQVNDTVVGTQLVQPNLVPIIGTEQLVTSVTIPDRNTIVLGGLISETFDNKRTGLPVLGRIPGLGKLFRTDNNTTTRKELIVFIQPQVVTGNPELRATSLSEDIRTKVGAEAANRFPQVPQLPAATPVAPEPKKNFFQRMFSRKPK
ncbi:secretin N-terminal domain-containing protein [Prosthecobacter sp.]|uniref:secretin N-terminal domain-containing protein n=1 Tax=Prosthecobacter sp. TaxID=1965333 RepID=UPI001D6B9D76|nr:secretin N-terminal domain-containing protein [Prosthecobacter sp.]MCB1276099.1 hypothetical protein [Prosthecobacter sp.]